MIPFEREVSLNQTEKYVEDLLKKDWDHVIRSTPGIKQDLEGRFPELSETISRRIKKDTESDFSDIFRPGVPDFLAFDDTGDYLFVEVKSAEDGLRHTQLKWLRDFQGVNMEIWFSENKEFDKLTESNFGSYGFSDVRESSDSDIEEIDGSIFVEVPDELAAITELEEESSLDWRLKSKDELVLDIN